MNATGHHDKCDLFASAAQMADADNYNDWTFRQFRTFVRGCVLEVGCGVGSFTGRILCEPALEHLVSIDLNPLAVSYCRHKFSHPKLDLRCLDLHAADGHYDTIICANVLEHIEDHRAAIKHLWQLLKYNGQLFVLVPAHNALFSRFDRDGGHWRRYNKRAFSEIISSVAGAQHYALEQYYFNIVGALGYWFVYKVLNRVPRAGAEAEIGLFDKWIVPIMRRLEGRHLPFGISLIAIVTKEPL